MDSTLLKKIRSLLAKGSCKSVTEEESRSFLSKAAELMAKHGLEMTDLPEENTSASLNVGEENVHVGRKREYELACGHVLEKCFSVKVLHGGRAESHFFSLIGTPDDVALAKEVLPMLRVTMSRGFIAWQKSKGITKWKSDEARAYYWGLARGYITASDEGKARAMAAASKEQQEAYGIILANKAEAITLWVSEKYPKLKQITEKACSENGAGQAGFAKGATLQLVQPKKLDR